ncbi:MAG TPA: amidase [Candidatus Nitrosotalea sp.]|nr:amidase [Candidatus Nitrosotalea sp.]
MTLDEARLRIAEQNQLRAFISVTAADGEGIAVGVKDNIDVRGWATSVGSRLRPPVPAPRDAAVIANIKRRGHLVLGKTNLHEWALGSTSANPYFGAVVNPKAPGRIPGGSSGGSAAAVAAGLCDWALGTDTGGSVRMPAAFCGVVGIRPSQGLISCRGVFPNSSTFDTVGPLAPDVESASRALWAMLDRDPPMAPSRPASELRLAVPWAWIKGLDRPVGETFDLVARGLPSIQWPDQMGLFDLYDRIALPEAAAVQIDNLTLRPGEYGSDVRARLTKGLGVSAADYLKAMLELRSVRRRMRSAMAGYDAVLLPTAPCVPPTLDEAMSEPHGPLGRFTRTLSLSGLPIVNLPVPGTKLPIGIQVVGHWRGEADLLQTARSLEGRWRALAV